MIVRSSRGAVMARNLFWRPRRGGGEMLDGNSHQFGKGAHAELGLELGAGLGLELGQVLALSWVQVLATVSLSTYPVAPTSGARLTMTGSLCMVKTSTGVR